MDSKSLVFYAKHNSEYDNNITCPIETITYEDPLEEVLNSKTIKQSQNSASITGSVKEQNVCDKPEGNTRSTNDSKDTHFSIDKEEITTQSLLDQYKYCKDVISFITSKNNLENSENKDLFTKPVYRNVNDVFVLTVTEDRTSCSKMNETKSIELCDAPKPSDTLKPCDAPKPSDTLKPCDAPKPSDTLKPCDAPKPSDTLKPCDALKPSDTLKPCDAPKPSDTLKPCDAPKPSDTLKPCDAPKLCDTLKPCDASKPCDATYPYNGPKTYESCSKMIYQSKQDIASSRSSCSCSEKTSKSKITCCPKISDSSCNVPADDCSSIYSNKSCVSPESQLSDCIMRCVKCLEDKKSADVSAKSSEPNAAAKPCSFHNVPIASPEVPPCPNKSSPTSSFQNVVVSSATTLSTFKTSVQDFIGTVCGKTREATKFVTDEGFKALGLKEKPKCSNKDSDLDLDCTKPKKCDFNKENDPNIERSEVKTAIYMYEDVSRKSSTSISGVLEDIVASKIDKSSKYDNPTIIDETGISFISFLGNIKDKVVSYLMNQLSDNNCESDAGGSGKIDTDEACHSDDKISPHHIIIINNIQADERKDSDEKTSEEKKNPAKTLTIKTEESIQKIANY